MIRVVLILLTFAHSANAQARLSDELLERLERTADEIASIQPGAVPNLLVAATIALGATPGEQAIPESLASLNLDTGMRTLERRAALSALSGMIQKRMSLEDAARVYLATVYFGRNCYGYRDAAVGLARTRPERADDAVWLALAALPRSPALYLRDRSALKARVDLIVVHMRSAGLIDEAGMERLNGLRLANIDSGKGCSSR